MVLSKIAVALVFLAFSVAVLKAQEPEQWPQDDDYAGQQQPDYSQQPDYGQQQYPQSNGYPQSDPQQAYGQQPSYGEPEQPGYGQPVYAPQQAMNAEQLEQLIAPIALYPDAVLAQILAASTYPAQIAAADQWLHSMGGAPPDQIAAAANAQTGWDPSVKALTAYPQILSMMNQNLQWTTALGNAYYNQPQDLLQTVQVLRQRAQGAGNLQTTPQQQVTADQGYISVAPANPQVVYVPTYNPWIVYGQPIAAYPGYTPLDAVGAVVGAAVDFGLRFTVGAFLAPFNLLGWGLDWLGHAILFGGDVWCSHSVSVHDWGFAHGGPRAFRGGEWARYGRGGYGRGGYGDHYGRGGYGGGYGHGGYSAYRNQPGFNRGSQFPTARAANGFGNRYQGGGNNRASNYPIARPGQGSESRYQGGFSRGSGGYNGGSGRGFFGSSNPTHPVMPQQQYAYNHSPSGVSRPQPYGGNSQFAGNRGQGYGYGSQQYNRTQPLSNYGQHSGFGSGSYSRPMPGYGGGRSFTAPSQSYRAPTPSFGHGFSKSPSGGYSGSYGQSSGRSGGGFHLFGGGHNNAPSYGGGSHSFGGFGGGGSHSFGGGGGHSFGGGGHSFGGGGHSFGGGGGHSGGGHSGGGGGHGHHR